MSISSHVAVNYHKMEMEEQKRQEVAHEAARERRDEDIDDLKVAVRSEEANEREDAHEPKRKIGPKEEVVEVCNACQEHGKVTGKSQPMRRERGTENQSARKEAKEEVCSACWEHEAVTRPQPTTGDVNRRTRNGWT